MNILNAKWNDLYKTEQELLEALAKVNLDEYKRRRFNGWQYIESFQKQYINKGTLSPAQMTVLKRLAKEIYKYHNWN